MEELKLVEISTEELPANYFVFTPENIILFKSLIQANKNALLNESLVNFDETRPIEFVKQLTLIKGAVNVLQNLIDTHEDAMSKLKEALQESNSNSQE